MSPSEQALIRHVRKAQSLCRSLGWDFSGTDGPGTGFAFTVRGSPAIHYLPQSAMDHLIRLRLQSSDRIPSLEAELHRVRTERGHFLTQLRAIRDRPDLGGRARLVQDLAVENWTLKGKLREQEQAIRELAQTVVELARSQPERSAAAAADGAGAG